MLSFRDVSKFYGGNKKNLQHSQALYVFFPPLYAVTDFLR